MKNNQHITVCYYLRRHPVRRCIELVEMNASLGRRGIEPQIPHPVRDASPNGMPFDRYKIYISRP